MSEGGSAEGPGLPCGDLWRSLRDYADVSQGPDLAERIGGQVAADRDKKDTSFWTTFPGMVTALAALLTALIGAYVALWPDNAGSDEPVTASAEGGAGPSTVPSESARPRSEGTPGSGSTSLPDWAVVEGRKMEGQFRLTPGGYVALGTGLTGQGEAADADLYWDPAGEVLRAVGRGAALAPGHRTANNWLSCDSILRREPVTELPLTDMVPGEPLCLRTRYGYLGPLAVMTVDLEGEAPEISIEGLLLAP